MQFQNLQMKRHFVSGKFIVGIDPSKEKYDAAVINPNGILQRTTFAFQNNHDGVQSQLWFFIRQRIKSCSPEDTIFAIEASCNLWQKLAGYITSQGFTVVMINPLSTHKARVLINHSFSKTDAKDALVIANAGREGYFDLYRIHPDPVKAMHELSITYDKLKKSLSQAKLRLRALVEQVFPEFCVILKLNTHTALYLLERYIIPQDFLNANILETIQGMGKVSRKQHGLKTLKKLQEAAKNSIGLSMDEEQIRAVRMSRDAWVAMIHTLQIQQGRILEQLITMTKSCPYFEILTSIKGISDISAALFIAETRGLDGFQHYKQIEAFAGLGLKHSDSGKYRGYRHISHIGNNRLRSIIYLMTVETKNHIPEIRIKYLNRQLRQDRYRRNIVSCSSNLLKLIMALVKENRRYEFREESVKELEKLENKIQSIQEKRTKKQYKKAS